MVLNFCLMKEEEERVGVRKQERERAEGQAATLIVSQGYLAIVR